MNKLILTAEAKRDLTVLKGYITSRLKNGAAALRVVGSITKELHSLERFPNMGHIVESNLNQSGYRVLVCGNYLAFYRVEGDTVYVDRILYGRRNYMVLLFGEEAGQPDHEDEQE